MIFVDSNVPMYVIGDDLVQRQRAEALCDRLVLSGEQIVTSAEVYQEIMHRYRSIGRLASIAKGFEHLDIIVDDVLAIDVDDVRSAHAILDRTPDFDARDALHIATMVRHGITRIASYDRGFDRVSDIERLS
ncbi:MAG: type II toxin-antitoxin system VapC family toxin [Actinobacteria bacterium]|nr:type II toxin-antitoxin system VapC family toxin [Actinomycetota bacterium]